MKIMFLISNLGSGGAERTVQYLSDYFSNEGDLVSIVIIGDIQFYDINRKVNVIKLNIASVPKNRIDRIKKIFARFVKVRSVIKLEHPDLIFCIMPGEIKYLIGLKKICHFKLVSSERILPESHSKKDLRNILWHYKLCDGVVFQTKRAADFYLESIKCKTKIIHNAVGNEFAYYKYSRDNIRNVISAVGRLCEQKDYVTLIKAFELVHNMHIDYKLEIYGEGPDRVKIESLIEQLNLQGVVILKGICKNAIQKIADTRMYVMSSKFEGMPNSLMEAMGIGLPVISTNCPNGPAELIEDGINGILVPVGNVQAMADAINFMIENSDVAEAMGNKAKTILETHSIKKQADEYRKFIYDVLENG